MLLQACLNGSRTPGEHTALPITPQELAQDAQRVVVAGFVPCIPTHATLRESNRLMARTSQPPWSPFASSVLASLSA